MTIEIPRPQYDYGTYLQDRANITYQVIARRFTMNGERFWEYKLQDAERMGRGEWERYRDIKHYAEMGDPDFEGDEFQGPGGV